MTNSTGAPGLCALMERLGEGEFEVIFGKANGRHVVIEVEGGAPGSRGDALPEARLRLYQVDARVVVQHRAEAPLTFIGGLTVRTPLRGAAVARREAISRRSSPTITSGRRSLFMPHAKAVLPSGSRVVFAPVLAWPQVRFVGLFKQDGGLLAWGRLRTSPGPAGHDELTFATSSVLLRFV